MGSSSTRLSVHQRDVRKLDSASSPPDNAPNATSARSAGSPSPARSDRRPTLPDTHPLRGRRARRSRSGESPITRVVFHVAAERLEPLTLDVSRRAESRTSWRRPSPVSVGARSCGRSQRPRHPRPPARRRAVADDRAQRVVLPAPFRPRARPFRPRPTTGVIDDDASATSIVSSLGSEHSSRPYRSKPKPLARYIARRPARLTGAPGCSTIIE